VPIVPLLAYLRVILIALGVIVLDQATKQAIVEWIGTGAVENRWEFAGRVLAFEYVENTGVAFGMLAGRPGLVSIFAIAVAALLLVVLGALLRADLSRSPVMQAAVGAVLGGAIGNLIDRLRVGYVIDFIAVGAWPKFNIADSAITVGVAVMVIALLRDDRPESTAIETPTAQLQRRIFTIGEDHHERNDVAR